MCVCVGGGGGGKLNKMVGAHGQCENGESNKNISKSPNLQISTELKSYICNANFVHIGVFVCMNLLFGGVR